MINTAIWGTPGSRTPSGTRRGHRADGHGGRAARPAAERALERLPAQVDEAPRRRAAGSGTGADATRTRPAPRSSRSLTGLLRRRADAVAIPSRRPPESAFRIVHARVLTRRDDPRAVTARKAASPLPKLAVFVIPRGAHRGRSLPPLPRVLASASRRRGVAVRACARSGRPGPRSGTSTGRYLARPAAGHGEAAAGDHLQLGWAFWLVGHQLEQGASPLADPYSFRPEAEAPPNLQGWLLGLPYWPLAELFGNVWAYNLILLLTFVLAGGLTCWWLRSLGLSRAGRARRWGGVLR